MQTNSTFKMSIIETIHNGLILNFSDHRTALHCTALHCTSGEATQKDCKCEAAVQLSA